MVQTGVVIAYLTSVYARATDTFIRDEVAQLRECGDEVVTFSIRRPSESEVINDEIAAERAKTTYLLDLPWYSFLAAAVSQCLHHPRRFCNALRAVRQLSHMGIRGRLWPCFYFLEACALAVRLRAAGADHLHDHIGEGSASVALLASELTGIPFSFTVHGPSEWDRPFELALDVKARHAAFVATISEYTRGQMRRWIAQEDWTKIHVVRCGVASEDESPATWSQSGGGVVVVSVGRLVHEKGHLVLLKSLNTLCARGRRLQVVLVGDGPERHLLESYVRDNGLAAYVHFLGWKPTHEVRETLRSSAALVMPSFAEGLPVSIMEAFLLGLPVISTDVGGVGELVEPGRSGWLVAPGSVEQLTDALEDLLSMTESERRTMGQRGRERVRRWHNISSEVSTLRDLIHAAAVAN